MPLSRKLGIWFGSAVIIGMFSIFYFGAPIGPVIIAAVLTLTITLYNHYKKKD